MVAQTMAKLLNFGESAGPMPLPEVKFSDLVSKEDERQFTVRL